MVDKSGIRKNQRRKESLRVLSLHRNWNCTSNFPFLLHKFKYPVLLLLAVSGFSWGFQVFSLNQSPDQMSYWIRERLSSQLDQLNQMLWSNSTNSAIYAYNMCVQYSLLRPESCMALEKLKRSTLVRTERGFETMNLKNCGRYFLSLSPSV